MAKPDKRHYNLRHMGQQLKNLPSPLWYSFIIVFVHVLLCFDTITACSYFFQIPMHNNGGSCANIHLFMEVDNQFK